MTRHVLRSKLATLAAWTLIVGMLAAASGFVAPQVASAAGTHTWTGAGSDNLWSNDDNWDRPLTGTLDGTVAFPAGAAALDSVNDIADLTVETIWISGSGFELSGLPVTVTGGVEATDRAGRTTISMPLHLGHRMVRVTTGASLELAGTVSGSVGLELHGGGRLVLSSSNTYTGETEVNGAHTTLVVTDDNALGSNSEDVTWIGSDSILALVGPVDIANEIWIGGDGVNGTGALRATSGASIVRVVTLYGHATITVDAGSSLEIDGDLYDWTRRSLVSKSGRGVLRLSAPASYAGEVRVSDGTFAVEHDLPADVVVRPWATLALDGGSVRGIQSEGTVLPGFGTSPHFGESLVYTEIRPGSTFQAVLNGNTPGNGVTGYSRLSSHNSVHIEGANLSLTLGADYTPVLGDVLRIIEADPVVGHFAGLPEGALIAVDGKTFRISYAELGGRRVTLTYVQHSAVTVTSSGSPSAPDAPVTFTASVTAASVQPTGLVWFYDNGRLFAAATLDRRGDASVTTSALTLGSHSIMVTYDGDVITTSGSGTIDHDVAVVQAAPVANPDEYVTDEDEQLAVTAAEGVIANDTDADDDPLSVVLVSTTTDGALSLDADGSFTYDPNEDFNGVDTFTYRAFDGGLYSELVTATITVNPVDDTLLGTTPPTTTSPTTTSPTTTPPITTPPTTTPPITTPPITTPQPDSTTPSIRTLTPARLVDTRSANSTVDGISAGAGTLPAGTTYTVQVAGRGGVPAGATGAVVNVTAVNPRAAGYMTLYPCGGSLPVASNLNFHTAQTVGNAAIVRLSAHGTLCVYTHTVSDLIVDVTGYVPPASDLGMLTPARLADTRAPGITVDGAASGSGLLPAGQTIAVQVTGRAGVPADADTVAVNLTAVEAAGAGYMTLFPCDVALPNASNVNFEAGGTAAASAVVKLSADGRLCVFTSVAAHVILDVNAQAANAPGLFTVTPARLADTRSVNATVDRQYSGDGRQAAGATYRFKVAGRGGAPASATAALLSVVATSPNSAGFVTVFPCGEVPDTSTLNFAAGKTVANSVVAQLAADGDICVYTHSETHLIVDVTGYLD